MKKAQTILMVALILGLGTVSAQTVQAADTEQEYLYVDVNGVLQVEVADSAAEALAQAENKHPHSGVMPVSANLVASAAVDEQEDSYWYVDTSGQLRVEVADSAEEALMHATDKHPHSGVVLIIK